MQQSNVWGMIYMVLHVCCAAGLQVGNRILAEGAFETLQVLAISHCFGMAMLAGFTVMGFVCRFRFVSLQCYQFKYHILRSFCYALSQALLIYAYTNLAFVRVNSITLAYPIIASIAGVVFLGNKMGAVRWISTLTGLIGALVVINPRPDDGFNTYSLFAVLALFLWVAFDVVTSRLGGRERLFVEFFYLFLCDLLFCIIFATGNSLPDWGLIQEYFFVWLLMGFIVLMYILTAVLSVRYAELVVVAPFYFLTLILGIAISHYVFHEKASLRLLVGSSLIVLSVIIIAYREYRAKIIAERKHMSRLNIM